LCLAELHLIGRPVRHSRFNETIRDPWADCSPLQAFCPDFPQVRHALLNPCRIKVSSLHGNLPVPGYSVDHRLVWDPVYPCIRIEHIALPIGAETTDHCLIYDGCGSIVVDDHSPVDVCDSNI
jgi:hypothetical protein